MTEDNSRLLKSPYSSALPDFDCNSNNNSNDRPTPGHQSTASTTEDGCGGGGGGSDGADYRWCLDLCYRNNQRQLEASGDGGGRRLRTSVLLGQRDISYDDLARNIDANLAEIDMEHFRSEDIESILALPAMCCGGHFPSGAHGEQTAELSLSLADKVNALRTSFSPLISPLPNCTSSDECQDDEEVEEEEEEEEEDGSDMSVCRSSPLFSPLKEQAVLPAFSVDSLDCESYDEHELMLTCRANKNNYTIAFEGSMCKFSDDSDYHEDDVTDSADLSNQQSVVRCRNCDSIDGSLVRSDFVYTTWNKLNKVNRMATHRDQQQRRDARQGHPPDDGGNNSSGASKSQSLPNLFRRSVMVNNMKVSQLRLSTEEEEEEEQRQHCVPVFSVNTSSSRSSSSRCSEMSLVRLFMQSRAGSGSVADSYSSTTIRQDHSAMYRSDVVVVDDGVRCDDDPAVGRNRAIGRVVSLDCDVRCVSPVASPIEEVDENDSSGENASSEDITVLHKITDNSCHGCHRPSGHSRATQTCTVSKEKDACSSCSGYVSGRSSSDRNTNTNPSRSRSRNSNNNNSSSSSQEGCCWGETKAVISRSESRATQIPIHVVDEAIQTSVSVSGSHQWAERVTEERETQRTTPPSQPKKAVYVCYPNYSLPDLKFLRVNDACALADAEMYLKPTGHRTESEDRNKWRKPSGLQTLRKDDLNRIQDLESLCVLLPTDVRQVLSTLRSEQSVHSSSSKEDSSSLKQLFVYNYDSSCEASTSTPTPPAPSAPPPAPPPPAPQPPPLPKRSISLLKTGSECCQIRPDGGEMPANVLLSRPPPINNPQLDRKRDLIGGVISAVQTLVEHFSSTTDPQEKFILGSSILSPASGHLVVDNLCPALHAVLDDGILPELYSLFGRIGNSIWKVVETSTRTGVTSRALNDLVARLNSENDLQEKQKFNAFIIGLLNIRSVDSWLAFLRTQDFIIRQHYHSTSLLFQSNGAFKLLFDDLLKALQPLAVLPFDLDLMFEKLHLDCRASCCCCNCDSPTKPLAMSATATAGAGGGGGGGCRSDSSSLSLTPSPSSPTPPPPPLPPGHDRHTSRAPPTPKRPLQRGTSRDSAVGTSCSATSTGMTSDLESAKSSVLVQRPRSCATAINGSPDDVLTVISEEDARVIRRWSAMLPSAGLTADFLNDVRLVSLARKLAEESRSCSVAPSCNDNDNDNDNTSSSSAETARSSDLGDDVPGEDFKRLQKKWEMLSGASSEDSKSRCGTNSASNNCNSKSKIPRLVAVCSSPNKTCGNRLEGEQWRSGSGSGSGSGCGRAAPPRDCSPSGRKLVAPPLVNNDRAARSAASRMQPSSRIG